MSEETLSDVAPRPAGLNFPNPSGRAWVKDEPQDKAPRGRGLRSHKNEEKKTEERSETSSQKKRRLEKRVGKGYVAAAKGINKLGAEYPSQVLLSQSESFVDSVMAMADEHPRIMEWIDSDLAVPATWQFASVCMAISLPLLAYYGFLPEFAGEIACDLFDVPPLPEEAIVVRLPEPHANGNGEREEV